MKTKIILLLCVLIMLLIGCGPTTHFGIGYNYYKYDNDYKKAVYHFEHAARENPTSDNYRWLGYAYIHNKQYVEGLVAMQTAIRLPNAHYVDEILKYMSTAYDGLDKSEHAIDEIQQVIKQVPDFTNNFEFLAGKLNTNKQYNDAIAAAKRAMELNPKSSSAYIAMAYAYYMTDRREEAVGYYKQALAIDSGSISAYSSLAGAYTGMRQYVDAVRTAQKGLEIKPDDARLLSRLSYALYMGGSYGEALSAADKLVGLYTITGIGVQDKVIGKYPVFEKVFDNLPAMKAGIKPGDIIKEIDGTSTKGRDINDIAKMLIGASGTEVVLEIERDGKTFEKRLIRETYFFKVGVPYLELRAAIYRKLDRSEEAMQDAVKAYDLDPDYCSILGALQVDSGHYVKAIETLSKDTAVSSKIRLATAYALLGKTKDAVDVYESIPKDELTPKDVPLWDDRNTLMSALRPVFTGHVASAEKCRSRGDYSGALDEYSEALVIASGGDEEQGLISDIFATVREMPNPPALPEEARRCTIRGDMLLEEGDFKGAVVEYKKAVGCAPYIARLYAQTALICEKMEDYPEAIRYMELYVQAAPDAPDARAAKDAIIKWEMIMERKDEG